MITEWKPKWIILWTSISINWWVVSTRFKRRCLGGLIRSNKEMLIMLSGLTLSTITLILIVIRTSRLSFTIRNAAQGKSSSEISTSSSVIRTVFRISTSIMFGALHKTLQLGMSRTALLLVLQLANSRGSLLITNNRNTIKLFKVKKIGSRIMILM